VIVMIPHAKFYADLLKTVAMHREQKTDEQTRGQSFSLV